MSIKPATVYTGPKDRREIHGAVFKLKEITRNGRASFPGAQATINSRRLLAGSDDEWTDDDLKRPQLIFGVKDGEIRIGVDGARTDSKAVKHDSLFQGASNLQAAGTDIATGALVR